MKNRYKKLVVNSLVVAIASSMLLACGGDSSSKDNTGHNGTVIPKSIERATLVSEVVDEKGSPLVGVTVKVAGQEKQTNTMGKVEFALKNVKDNKVVLLIKKAGYLTTAKEVMLQNDKKTTIAVKLFADQITTKFKSSDGVEVESATIVGQAKKIAKVNIPANVIVDAKGVLYQGEVNLAMSYYGPEDLQGVQSFAQPYVGVQENNAGNTDIISVGVIEVKLSDQNGDPLQLKSGSTATITFPKNSVSDGLDSIPLWHYDEDKKIWIEDGAAKKQADGSYKGEVNHFTLWNLDVPIKGDRALLKGCFEDQNGERLTDVYSQIVTTGWSNRGGTSDGIFEVYVPANRPLTLYPNVSGFVGIPIPALSKGEVRDNTNQCYVINKILSEDGLSYTLELEVPPVARDNYKSVSEGNPIKGNVITDVDGIDTDANGDPITVVSYTVDTNGDNQAESFNANQQAVINNVGTFTLNSDGSYQFTAVNNYSGNVPTINYTITDGKQGMASAELTLEVRKINNGGAVVGKHILGYHVIPLMDYDNLTSGGDPANLVKDLVISTYYVEDGHFTFEYKTLKGSPLSEFLNDQYNEIEYTLTDKMLSEDKYDIEKKGVDHYVYTDLSGVVTQLDTSSYQGYFTGDEEATIKAERGKYDIGGKSINTVLFAGDLMYLDQLPEGERVFASGEQCYYTSSTTSSKPFISFSRSKPATTGSQTMKDLTNQSESIINKISGTWASIPWVASADVDSEGDSQVYVLHDGNVINEYEGYSQAGTFPVEFDGCEWYSKEQADFITDAMKKAFPRLQ